MRQGVKGIIFFSVEKETIIINCEQDFFVHRRIVSSVKEVEFVSDRMSYIYIYIYFSEDAGVISLF